MAVSVNERNADDVKTGFKIKKKKNLYSHLYTQVLQFECGFNMACVRRANTVGQNVIKNVILKLIGKYSVGGGLVGK